MEAFKPRRALRGQADGFTKARGPAEFFMKVKPSLAPFSEITYSLRLFRSNKYALKCYSDRVAPLRARALSLRCTASPEIQRGRKRRFLRGLRGHSGPTCTAIVHLSKDRSGSKDDSLVLLLLQGMHWVFGLALIL